MTIPTIRPQGAGLPTGFVTHPRVAVVESEGGGGRAAARSPVRRGLEPVPP